MRPRAVVVGAGFAGVAAARRLAGAPVDTLVVDKRNFHLFTPLLYQVASSLLAPSEIAQPVRAILRGVPGAEFRMAEVLGVDLRARMLATDRGPLPYDYLILAAGSVNDHFGLEGVARGSFNLKDMESALELRNRVLSVFESARWTADGEARRRLLTFTVIGGGPTGIEYAGALGELVGLVLRRDFRELDVSEVSIELIEASDHLLDAFLPGLREAARHHLETKGIRLRLGTSVKSLRGDDLELAGGTTIPAGTVVWAAGVRAAPLGATLAVPIGHGGAVEVLPTLQLRGRPEVFVAGDMAAVGSAGGQLPMLATVAIQEGQHAAAGVRALATGAAVADFSFRDPGIMATIGRNAAVVQTRRLRLTGRLGWLAWLAVHLVRILTLRSRAVVLINWAWNYVVFDRPVRLILRASGGGRPPAGDRPGIGGDDETRPR
ncbi:MAG: NAD(P)/FAD-dependent oxidoreductase [Candidatus Dormibacteraceae bacterium]